MHLELNVESYLVPAADSLMRSPKFEQKLGDLKVKDGEQVNLSCIVYGDPDPKVTWYKNGEVRLLKISWHELCPC